MPRTPDRNINVTEYSDETLFEDFGLPDPTVVGAIRFRSGAWRQMDGLGVYDPRGPWASILEGAAIDSPGTLYRTITGTVAPSQVAWYSDAAKTKLVCMSSYVYGVNTVLPATITHRIYNTNGSVRVTAVETITYSGAFETGRTRTFS